MFAALVLAALAGVPQQFASLPLQTALQHAVRISPEVAQARERIAENRALLAAARGQAAPSLQASYAAAPQGGNANDTIEQSLATIGAGVTLGDYLQYLPAVRQAEFALAGARYDLLDAQRMERVKTIGLYYGALEAVAAEKLRAQELTVSQSDLRAAKLRFRAGDAPRLDVVRAQVGVADARANLDAARVAAVNAENALAVETGVSQSDLAKIASAPALSPPPSNPQTAVARALARRSDLLSAEKAVRAEEAAVQVAQRGTLPIVSVNAGYTHGYDSGVLVSGPSANLNVSFPLSRANADRVAAERARLAETRYKEAALRRSIAVAVSSAARTYRESIGAVVSARKAREAAAQEMRATEIGYRSGASSSLDVADARRTYVQAALAQVRAVYAQAQAAATLEEEMGP